jgi:RNA polymerase sigma-70 factor (ECF subfamily)
MLLTDEEKLVNMAIAGNFEAFEQLIENYTLPLSRFVTRLMGNSEEARDAVQQILIQVYQGLPALQNPTFFKAWLFKIARNKCFEILRHQNGQNNHLTRSGINGQVANNRTEAEDEDVNSIENSVPDPGPLPLELIEREETRLLLQEAINGLPPRSRQVVVLRYTTDLTFAEIAQVLDTNENTVKTLFQRGKARLRTVLGRQDR